ncbi:DUF262 domain-containing protein [Ruegeria sp. HKCCD6428]|uniref:DUF262 domain-containing protein n=1 Tax=Ruegeria sp. HKCCD6428 TaxID=2683002 RepID=UPI0014923D8A|nr:DUF262 domain-containing protein [Ruegeria sp. HKCCD6428]NOC84532.1 DUF262 domain-containing protein [Ruegeria sp. HKCCD6428]
MDVHRSAVMNIFEAKQRLEIPLFQRQYVWNEENQWLPLWEDIERKFSESLEGNNDTPNHFLGAMVLDQKQTPTGHVIVRQVIDGQQRLTTLQIFLSAFRDFCREVDCTEIAAEVEQSLFNKGMMANKDVDQFKVWPTKLDRQQFTDVISAGTREELLKRYPTTRRKYARKPDPKPRMVEAYFYFFDLLKDFFLGEEDTPPLAADFPISDRLEHCLQVLKSALLVVVIDLDRDDDPQVIFETLNARGQPLLPADLIRNYIFLRARRENLDTDDMYERHWSQFDSEFWREEIKQGRLNRPRSDIFIQHLLSSRQARDVPIKHLYVEYRHWSESIEASLPVADELKLLSAQGQNYRRLLEPEEDDPVAPLAQFIRTFEVSTLYPLVLAFFEANPNDDEWKRLAATLESYIIRRAICDLTTKNYNKVFLGALRRLRKTGFSADNLYEDLKAQTGESSLWPDDGRFREGWMRTQVYRPLGSRRLVHILGKLDGRYGSSKSEQLKFSEQPTVEHIMPQSWVKNWPLASGEKGMDPIELMLADDDDQRAKETRHRSNFINRIGNLTILSQALNAAESNLAWGEKRPKLLAHSLLPLNLQLGQLEHWDEDSIEKRARELFEHAKGVWAR